MTVLESEDTKYNIDTLPIQHVQTLKLIRHLNSYRYPLFQTFWNAQNGYRLKELLMEIDEYFDEMYQVGLAQ